VETAFRRIETPCSATEWITTVVVDNDDQFSSLCALGSQKQ